MTSELNPCGPAYKVVTPRLILRAAEPGDLLPLDEAVRSSLPQLRQWMLWAKDEPVALSTRMKWIREARGRFDLDQDYVYLIVEKESGALIGGTGLHLRSGDRSREIGYWIRSDKTNRGYASEAAAALTQVAFGISRVDRVDIHCDPRNQASVAVARKLGFHLEATLRQRQSSPEGVLRDVMIWSIVAPELKGSRCLAISVDAFDILDQPLPFHLGVRE